MDALPAETTGWAGPRDLVEDFGVCNGIWRCIGRTRGGSYGIVMGTSAELAADEGYRSRFLAEADKARRLRGPGVAQTADVSPGSEPCPWVVYGAWPALPLPAAVTAHGGGFPEPVVRWLAGQLAQVLLRFHSHGLVYGGLCPHSLLITRSGPQLTGYGLLRAAAPEGAERRTVPGMPAESIPREQLSGAPAVPAADVYALGAVLRYAATGAAGDPPLSQLSPALREMVADCLAADPARRPRTDTLLQRLRGSGEGLSTPALPEAVESALQEQSGRLWPEPADVPPPPPYPPGAQPSPRETAPEPGPQRRTLLTGAVAGGAGLVLGSLGIGAWRLASGTPKPAPKLAMAGTAPAPLWRYRSEQAELGKFTVVADEAVVLATPQDLIGIDLRTGRKLWSRDDAGTTSQPVDLGRTGVLVPNTEKLLVLSPKSGKVKWSEDDYGGTGATFTALYAHKASTVWFLLQDIQKDLNFVVAYRARDRKELWRRKIPSDFALDTIEPDDVTLPVLRDGALILPNTATGSFAEHHAFLALDARTGRRLWQQTYRDLDGSSEGLRLPVGQGLFLSGEDDVLRMRHLRTGKVQWKVRLKSSVQSKVAVHGDRIYATDSQMTLYALDKATGRVRWHRKGVAVGGASIELGETHLSSSGRTLFHATDSETDAFRARDGAALWRLGTAVPRSDDGLATAATPVSGAEGMALFADKSTLYALPAD